ncbi:hypothetical protein FOPG_17595 [Fusarium oxysporum f. sp. conglutinans race 2 54008]|uniref:Uncharacterized protein n=1 Tax=Fusarium oxysporum f. sp. conglutinans race 2 54008 TaxID=1089457 RepID=X0GS95_FUSOX|nr:hypothetical protein FOPG_17595 [Fusarium oxysporum f. sp. conglutinans race 2 54008]
MVEYAEQGNELRTHRDVPPYILDMIYEKERLDGERRVKRKAPSLESDRPIKIVNVLPSPPLWKDDYTEWLCDQVEDEHWKAGFRSAAGITKADCLDLRHVYQDQVIGYYVNQGVKAGIARSFVQDIRMWTDSL